MRTVHAGVPAWYSNSVRVCVRSRFPTTGSLMHFNPFYSSPLKFTQICIYPIKPPWTALAPVDLRGGGSCSSALSHCDTSALALMRVGIYLRGVHAGRELHFQLRTHKTHLRQWECVYVNDATSRQNHTLNWKNVHTHAQWLMYTR